jgi:hypothetical protein
MNAEANEVSSKTKEVEKVPMGDGRTVEFAGKRKLLKETIIDGSKVGIRCDFRNGETRTYWIPDGLFQRFAGHGAEQKYGDETAGVEDVDDMVLATDDLDGRIQKGEWSIKREGGGMAGTSVLLRALMEFSNRTAEQVKEFLTGKTQSEKLALRNSPKIKPIVERLEAEKLSKAAKVDTGALLAELG